jgi:hypothetical protein
MGWKIQPRYAFAFEYTVWMKQMASSFFEP